MVGLYLLMNGVLNVQGPSVFARGLRAVCRRTMSVPTGLLTLRFDNKTLHSLPIDEVKENFPRQVRGACFSRVNPTPVENPQLVCFSESAVELLGLKADQISPKDLAQYFSGNKILSDSEPAAHCYCGHQFGYFSGQLGDGAAIYLGEVIGENQERWEIQLKGAGLTPYSRTADGRKVLRSSIREFLCSEAMHALGIPTTRAGCIVTSDTRVIRDQFYDGRAKHERASIVLRIAPTFLRFGSFEICKSADSVTGREGPSHGNTNLLKKLLDFAVASYFPQITGSLPEGERYLALFENVVDSTARLVAEWQCVGFCHGVLNTDNMSIAGLTIDYGPFGFLDSYESGHICNSSDEEGRYSYKNQPKMVRWNLEKFAEALSPLLDIEKSRLCLTRYDEKFEEHYLKKMRCKLGLKKEHPNDKFLVEELLNTMEKTGADFTNTFRSLSTCTLPQTDADGSAHAQCLQQLLSACCSARELQEKSRPRISMGEVRMLMQLIQMQPGMLGGRDAAGPLKRELDRAQEFERRKLLTNEAKHAADHELWTKWLQIYRDRLARETDGSHAESLMQMNGERVTLMKANNPRVVLRNYIAEQAIRSAEEGDFTEVERVLRVLQSPYTDEDELTISVQASSPSPVCVSRYAIRPPDWATALRVS